MSVDAGFTNVYVRNGLAVMVTSRVKLSTRREGRYVHQYDTELSAPKISLKEDDASLGSALRTALISCPMVDKFRVWVTRVRKGPYLLDPSEVTWEPKADENLAALFGLKSKRGLFSGMRLLGVDMIEGNVTITPTWRSGVNFEFFRTDYAPKQPTILPMAVSDVELGAALRDAHARSSG